MTATERSCAVDGCGADRVARGWCSMHYARWKRSGDPGTAAPTRGVRLDRACKVDDCDGKYKAHGLCVMHWNRVRNGLPVGDATRLRQAYGRDESCHYEGCENPRSGGKWCAPHWQGVYKFGEPQPLRYKWSDSWKCVFCGAEVERGGKYRKYCDSRCARMWSVHGSSKRDPAECQRCGGDIDLMALTKAGQFKRSDTKMCSECKRGRATRHGWSVKAIVRHHGTTDCGICGEPVDLSLRKPDLMSPSIDHIIPYAHGGSNDVENLQLAHLHCNHVKSDSGWQRGKRVKRA